MSLLCFRFELLISIIALVTSFHYAELTNFRRCNSLSLNAHSIVKESELDASATRKLRSRLDKEFLNISIPAFIGLTTEPGVSILEAIYIARLGTAEQAGLGIAIASQYSVAKLYNDPLLKTTTSLVAGKIGKELSASVSTAIATAMFIGLLQALVYILFAEFILKIMGVSAVSDMRVPALKYLRWRALGVPAATVLIVSNGIFRGRGDTKTPLYYTTLGSAINVILDPILMFGVGMGISGAGLAHALSQWITVLPLLYLLNKSIPFQIFGFENGFLKQALKSYIKSGSLIFLRTIAKISTYTIASSSAAKLGTVPMAAYALTFNLGFTASQLCESLAIAAQALLARDYPFDTTTKKVSANHVIKRSLQSGLAVSLGLAAFIIYNLESILNQMAKSPDVKSAALAVMPAVILAQIFKSISSSSGGILLGGLDWSWSTAGMIIASSLSIFLIYFLPATLNSIWISLGKYINNFYIYVII